MPVCALLPPPPPPPTPHPQIDRFLYSSDNQVVAGALLAVGIVNSGVQDEVDPALALLAGGCRCRRCRGSGWGDWGCLGLTLPAGGPG